MKMKMSEVTYFGQGFYKSFREIEKCTDNFQISELPESFQKPEEIGFMKPYDQTHEKFSGILLTILILVIFDVFF